MGGVVTRPAHVPPEREYDFDFYSLGAQPDIYDAWRQVQLNAPDIFWTPRNGGHWVAARGEAIKEIQLDHERFSHAKHYIPFDENAQRALPLHVDPPEQRPYRRLIAPAFYPKVVSALEATVREIAVDLVEKFARNGKCEFMEEFARHLPIAVFLQMMDLPLQDRELLLGWADEIVRSGSIERRARAQASSREYLQRWIGLRKGKDGADLISLVANAEIEGRAITPDETLSVCGLLLTGGLDTVASMLGFAAYFLAQNPEHRALLREHPEKERDAIEELLRRFGIPNTARMITQDMTYRGVDMKAGEQIQVSTTLYGLDERITEDPMRVDFDRGSTIRHVAFGSGPHTCPGAVLARRELSVFLQEWLRLIPDFCLDPARPAKFATGTTNAVVSLHLVW